ncbi:MAG: RiPP maturation radical SAM C-methyltransferase [Deltaproteobacteria bacterium]|nr:RiPP maturation radical SAM C-methyltransferase [Deltaproteobacteria bacterium]
MSQGGAIAGSAAEPRVLLVTMPWMNPGVSCLALGTLRPLLEAAGLATDTLYGNVLFPRTETDGNFLDHYGSFLFVPWLYPDAEVDVDALLERITRRYFDQINLDGLVHRHAEQAAAAIGVYPADVKRSLREDIVRAGVCLERCLDQIALGSYDVVGFTATFETQLPATLALARRLKAKHPALKIMLGGAACFEEQGDGLAGSFAELDVVCHTEGESVIVPLVRALRGELALAEVPGIAYRGDDGRVVHNASPSLLEDLDVIPVPAYRDYLAALHASEWKDLPPKLLFETSRGCWWGQKHLCTFCGLNAEGLAFRSKSPERAYREIEALYRDYPESDYLQATDNILDMKYLNTVMPRLAEMPRDPGRPLQIFFEVKSNLKPHQLRLMSAAGIKAVQPGIESFDDKILELMDKGCTGLGQVQFLKWAYQEGLQAIYNILIANPGEAADSYQDMIELLPHIAHLPPPSGLARMALERFSPYFERASSFGIENKRPKPYYTDLYPEPGVDLGRIAYHFDYDHPMQHDERLHATLATFAQLATDWTKNWQGNRAFYLDRDDHLVVVDRRSGVETIELVAGVAAQVYRFLDAVRSFTAVVKHFPEVEASFLRNLIERWHHQRLVFSRPRDDLHLAVLPRFDDRPRDVRDIVRGALAPPTKPASAVRPRPAGGVRLAVIE